MQYSDNFLVKRCRSFHMCQKEKRLLRIYGKRPVTVHHGPNPNSPLDTFSGHDEFSSEAKFPTMTVHQGSDIF